jgi:DNA-binding XRE family transcriptional regulator
MICSRYSIADDIGWIFRVGAFVVMMKERKTTKTKVEANNVRKIREGLLMSKAELARRAGLSVLTIDRVEKGMACRMDTKRKIILSLGLQLSDRDKVFLKDD